MKLNQFFKIGKEKLIKMIKEHDCSKAQEEIVDNITYENTNIYRDFINDVCSDCVLKITIDSNIDTGALELRNDYCLNHCEKRQAYINNRNASNNSDKFIFAGKKRLSRLQLSQLLLYHALGVGPTGIVHNISESEIANILNCTIKTVRNNNKRLVDWGYILFSRVSKDKFNILILDYNKYHLSSKEGGRGYVVMSNKTLMKLLNIKNVNALRIEIRNLVEFDDNNVKRIRTREVSSTYKEISSFLPDYINHKAIINKIIDKTSGIFNVRKVNDKIYYNLKAEFDGKNERRKLGNKYKQYFRNYCKNKSFSLNEKDYDDLVQMSIEYRFNTVMSALDIVYKKYFLSGTVIENCGGLVREIIKKKTYEKKLV